MVNESLTAVPARGRLPPVRPFPGRHPAAMADRPASFGRDKLHALPGHDAGCRSGNASIRLRAWAPDFNHFEMCESLGNLYGPNGLAAFKLMRLA
jgi:hypothetical protein